MTTDPHDATLVSVFIVRETGLMPLVAMVLEQEQIEYSVRGIGALASVVLNQPDQPVVGADGGSEIFVRAADADRARALLEALEDAPPIEDPTTTE